MRNACQAFDRWHHAEAKEVVRGKAICYNFSSYGSLSVAPGHMRTAVKHIFHSKGRGEDGDGNEKNANEEHLHGGFGLRRDHAAL